MIEPLLARIMCLVAALVTAKTDFRFTFITASHCSSFMRISRPSRVMRRVVYHYIYFAELFHHIFYQLLGLCIVRGIGAVAFYFAAVSREFLL
ncbi:hypothetical protein GCM10028895_18810 [Pontibacter rugosus]